MKLLRLLLLSLVLALIVWAAAATWWMPRPNANTAAVPAENVEPEGQAARTESQEEPARQISPNAIALPAANAALPVAATKSAPQGEAGLPISFSRINPSAWRVNDQIELPGAGGKPVQARVRYSERDADGWLRVSGVLEGEPGQFFFNQRGAILQGDVLLSAQKVATIVDQQADGKQHWTERPLSSVVCVPPMAEAASALPAAVPPPVGAPLNTVPLLDSKPSATGVIYLDFDGALVVDPSWNGGAAIDVPDPDLEEDVITTTWEGVADKFASFNVSVTTNAARYAAAPVGRRMRCIISSNTFGNEEFGGIAYLDSWSRAGSTFSATVPCWAFIHLDSDAAWLVHVISHEVGHTFGLQHDGYETPPVEYHPGWIANVTGNPQFPNYRWQPIMGGGGPINGYILYQWSQGGYTNASNTEDDVAIIANTTNGIGFSADEDTVSIPDLGGNGSFSVTSVLQRQSDTDSWIFNTSGGLSQFVASPDTTWGTVDTRIDIRDETTDAIVAQSDILDTQTTDFTTNLPAGRYRLTVVPVGNGAGLTNGYLAYGSVGEVRVVGTYPSLTNPIVGTLANITPQPGFALPQGTNNAVLAGFTLNHSGAAAFTAVTVAVTGTATAADVTGLRIFRDVDGSGTINGADAAISGTLAHASTLNFTGLTGQVFTGTRNYLIVGNITPGATEGRTVAVQITPGAFVSTASTDTGSATGRPRLLGVPVAPFITGQPIATQNIARGGTASMSVTASGLPAPTFQWYTGVSGDMSNPISGAILSTFVTPALATTTDYWVRATNSEGSVNSSTSRVRVLNPDLDSLSVSAGSLSPEFATGTFYYNVTVAAGVTGISITPVVSQSGSTVRVNTIPVASGSPSAAIPLAVGVTPINVTVTSELALISQAYVINVTRLSNNASLSGLALVGGSIAPSFATTTIAYTATVPFSSSTVQVMPSATTLGSALFVNGTPVLSGGNSQPIPLQVGSNLVTVRVVSSDATASQDYTMTITRRANSSLATLTANAGTLNPPFSPTVTSYSLSVPFTNASLQLDAVAADPAALVTGSGFTPGSPVSLNVGVNVLPITVTATDGSTTSYTVTVTRKADPTLANLVPSQGELDPSFNPETTNYGVTVPFTTTQLTLTPTVAAPGATVKVNGSNVPSGTASAPLALARGPNVISVVSTGNDGLDVRTYTVTVTRTFAEIEVRVGSRSLISGTSTFAFPDVPPGTQAIQPLVIRNEGAEPLTGLALALNGAPQFSASLGVTSLAGGDSIELPLTFASASPGAYSTSISISSSDLDENPFVFTVTGRTDHRADKAVTLPAEEAPAASAVRSSWEAAFAGTFEGLLRSSTDPSSLLGAISNLVITPPIASATEAPASGNLQINGRSVPFRGGFRTSSGQLDSTITLPDGASLALSLRLMETTPGDALIRGFAVLTPTAGARSFISVELAQAPDSRRNPVPAPLAGNYTILFPGNPGSGASEPGGDGWATMNVSPAGLITVAGALGDGTRITESSLLTSQDTAALYLDLYRTNPNPGRFGGTLTFRDLPGVSDVDGRMNWVKSPAAQDPLYAAGFNIIVTATGGKYTPPTAGQRVLPQLADADYNAEISFIRTAEGSAGEVLDRILSWTARHQLIHYGPERFTGAVAAPSGRITGSFTNPATQLPIAFTGLVLQKQGIAAGVFTDGNRTAAFRILPGTDHDYPGREPAGPLPQIRLPLSAATLPEANTPFDPSAAGSYSGLLLENGQADGTVDAVTISASGALSGTLWLDGVPSPFKGFFSSDGSAPIPILRAGNFLQLTLLLTKITGSSDGFGLMGSLTDGTQSFTIDAQRLPAFTALNRSPNAGAYTFAVPGPDPLANNTEPVGDSAGTLRVSALGGCTGLVTLADGTKVTLAGQVGVQHPSAPTPVTEWTFFRGLYGRVPKGLIGGKITFREVTGTSSLDGSWRWVKPATLTPAPGVPGFDVVRPLVGSRYTPPSPGLRALAGVADGSPNVWLRFAGPGLAPGNASLPASLDRVATWLPTNKLIHYGPDAIGLSFDPASGVLSGSYREARTGRRLQFYGVLIQDQNFITGNYQNGTTFGWMGIVPR